MGESGTLILARSKLPERSKYSVALAVPGRPHSQRSVYPCHSDLRLLRALEDLIEAPDVRLGALERLRKEGHAAIPNVEFLRGMAGKQFCHTCLARLFLIEFDQARKLVARLRRA